MKKTNQEQQIYLKNLLNQYSEQTGKSIEQITVYEFKDWCDKRQKQGQEFLQIIKTIVPGFKNEEVILELGKGDLDTISTKGDIVRCTPYSEKGQKEQSSSNEKIINGYFRVLPNGDNSIEPTSSQNLSKEDVANFVSIAQKGKCAIIANPYSEKELSFVPEYLQDEDLEVIIGMYGNSEDQDRISKIAALNQLKKKLLSTGRGVTSKTIEDKEGNYYKVLAAHRK